MKPIGGSRILGKPTVGWWSNDGRVTNRKRSGQPPSGPMKGPGRRPARWRSPEPGRGPAPGGGRSEGTRPAPSGSIPGSQRARRLLWVSTTVSRFPWRIKVGVRIVGTRGLTSSISSRALTVARRLKVSNRRTERQLDGGPRDRARAGNASREAGQDASERPEVGRRGGAGSGGRSGSPETGPGGSGSATGRRLARSKPERSARREADHHHRPPPSAARASKLASAVTPPNRARSDAGMTRSVDLVARQGREPRPGNRRPRRRRSSGASSNRPPPKPCKARTEGGGSGWSGQQRCFQGSSVHPVARGVGRQAPRGAGRPARRGRRWIARPSSRPRGRGEQEQREEIGRQSTPRTIESASQRSPATDSPLPSDGAARTLPARRARTGRPATNRARSSASSPGRRHSGGGGRRRSPSGPRFPGQSGWKGPAPWVEVGFSLGDLLDQLGAVGHVVGGSEGHQLVESQAQTVEVAPTVAIPPGTAREPCNGACRRGRRSGSGRRELIALARPKSVIQTTPSASRRRFAGLMSRCKTPESWACWSPSATCRPISATPCQCRKPDPLAASFESSMELPRPTGRRGKGLRRIVETRPGRQDQRNPRRWSDRAGSWPRSGGRRRPGPSRRTR